jgi:aspartate dehydrogenase
MSETGRKKVGLIGCGTIGSRIARTIMERDLADIVFVCDLDEKRVRQAVAGAKYVSDLAALPCAEVDIVIETANADVVRAVALDILRHCDFLPFTVTAMADAEFYDAVKRQCEESGTHLYIPHGGILGLDGIHDGRNVIHEVTFRTIKNPKNLGLKPSQVGTIFDGTTREACRLFPRNVNVHATLALMGVGFDRQRSIIISDPDTKKMSHEITVVGDGLEWKLTLSSMALAGVTGSYTPESAASTVTRVLGGERGIVVA